MNDDDKTRPDRDPGGTANSFGSQETVSMASLTKGMEFGRYKIVRRVERILSEEANVDVFVAETGVAGGDPFSGAQSSANEARVTVDDQHEWTIRSAARADDEQ